MLYLSPILLTSSQKRDWAILIHVNKIGPGSVSRSSSETKFIGVDS